VGDHSHDKPAERQRDGVVTPMGNGRMGVANAPKAVLFVSPTAREQDFMGPGGEAVR